MRIIPPTEGDLIPVERNQPVIGNGHTVSVTAEVAKDLLRAAKGRLGIDDPFLAVKLPNELGKVFCSGQVLDETGKAQTFFSEGMLQAVDELSTEDVMEHLHG
jgi:hypothetical protein